MSRHNPQYAFARPSASPEHLIGRRGAAQLYTFHSPYSPTPPTLRRLLHLQQVGRGQLGTVVADLAGAEAVVVGRVAATRQSARTTASS